MYLDANPAARQNASHPRHIPATVVPHIAAAAHIPGIRQAIAAARYLLDMFRRQPGDENTRRQLQRLDHRLLAVASQLDRITKAEK